MRYQRLGESVNEGDSLILEGIRGLHDGSFIFWETRISEIVDEICLEFRGFLLNHIFFGVNLL